MGSGEGASDLFLLKSRLELPLQSQDHLECQSKITIGGVSYFAASVKYSGDLILASDGLVKSRGTPDIPTVVEKKWSMKVVPWFEDGNKRISALTHDDEGILYVGTRDGHIYELNAIKILEDAPGSQNELKLVFTLSELRMIQLVVWHRENMKMILCNGDNCKLAIIHVDALPVVVTFLANIIHMEIFINTVGLSCLLVCLENSTNVYCVLDDLEVPIVEPEEVPGKKSIFRKARDNLMSKFSDEKMNNFFNRKTNKESGNTSAQKPPSVISSTSIAAPQLGSSFKAAAVHKFPISNVKFSPVEEVHCRGLLKKIGGKNQFSRHVNNKLDIFDVDFRQTAAVYIPSHISRLFVVQRIFFGIDDENKCVRVSVIHSGTLKEFAIIPFQSKILSIEAIDEEDPSIAPYSVFIVSFNGIAEVYLAKSPIDTCVDMLLKETNNVMLEVVCSALNVVKSNVCVLAGDRRAEEGKFAKAILYYKIAGLNYMKIMAKFGSRGHIAAMLCFYELMDQEQKNKLSGNNQDRQAMANLALLGRIEQYLRHGRSVTDPRRGPKNSLKKMLTMNPHYSAKQAATLLCNVPLLWALKLLGTSRLCCPHILNAFEAASDSTSTFIRKKAFWEMVTADWLALYIAPPTIFVWFRDVVLQNCKDIHIGVLHKLILALMPWRRELQNKFFDPRTQHTTEVIDFTVTNDAGRVPLDQYVSLFITLLLEAIKRENPEKLLVIPNFLYKSALKHEGKPPHEHHHFRRSSDPKSVWLQSSEKTFAASSHHCACIRNGKVFTWGENKVGRLGHSDDRPGRLNIETPTPIDLSPTLRIYAESVSCGINHNLVLTSVGTVLTWGSNALGQLGVGPHTVWTTRPIPVTLAENVIVIRVAAGGYHSVAIDHLNRVWTWGWGIHGQLGDGGIESRCYPKLISVPFPYYASKADDGCFAVIFKEKIISASAGHCHTALLSESGHVYTFGCSHFGQTGQGLPQKKVKVPTRVTDVPSGVVFKIVEAGLCGTAMVSSKNKLYYAGLNPGTLRTLLSGQKRREQRNNALAAGIPQSEIVFEEEKDFSSPVLLETAHVGGEIIKVNVATTHMGVLTSHGLVYTWGLGKSGQLVRPDDDSRTLELIDTEDRAFSATDICCGGDCTFVIERDSHRCFGCGFNSSGQLGKLQSEEESAVMTIKTKKRVVKVRQPSNIYFRLREITGLPKPVWTAEPPVAQMTPPPSLKIDQELLEWFLRAFKRHYDPKVITELCIEYENYSAASLLETMAESHEFALKHSLSLRKNKANPSILIGNYLQNREKAQGTSTEQATLFLRVVIGHWSENSLPCSELEEILGPYMKRAPWDVYLNSALATIIASADDSAEWIATHMTPLFILSAIKECHEKNVEENDAGSELTSSTPPPPSDSFSNQVVVIDVAPTASEDTSAEPNYRNGHVKKHNDDECEGRALDCSNNLPVKSNGICESSTNSCKLGQDDQCDSAEEMEPSSLMNPQPLMEVGEEP